MIRGDLGSLEAKIKTCLKDDVLYFFNLGGGNYDGIVVAFFIGLLQLGRLPINQGLFILQILIPDSFDFSLQVLIFFQPGL